MNETLSVAMLWTDWFNLFKHFASISIASVGGPLVLLPEIYHFLVNQQNWLTDEQFSASVVIAQASPGPNVMFVALMGWNIGLNAGGFGWAAFSALLCMAGILLPSSVLIFVTARWVQAHQNLRAVRAFKLGLSPVVISMMVAAGWLLATANTDGLRHWPLWLLAAVTALIVYRTKIHMLLLLAIGAALGASGLLVVG
ncbi:chromate transporter [Zwartia vadi]|uniref:chromate transporter n=1 Tax=Zwartia vadi TaxID=3058168 RepID=UPI0025B5A2BE|nr:chromate transporter [Zwartia vadi]MDN3986960.1 chromate transporter [Zwartia vadi]